MRTLFVQGNVMKTKMNKFKIKLPRKRKKQFKKTMTLDEGGPKVGYFITRQIISLNYESKPCKANRTFWKLKNEYNVILKIGKW